MKKLFLLITMVALVMSCSEDNLETETDLVKQQNIGLNAKQQKPLSALDNDNKGLYLGVYVSGSTTERGLIWVNLGNNDDYTAVVEMRNGKTHIFKGEPTSMGESNYHFEAKNAQFDVILENDVPVIENASLNNELFFGEIVKDRSNVRALALTGTFISDDTNVSGTWNLIADGSIPNPNGFNGEGITSAIVTWQGNVYTDTSFENYNFPCISDPDFVPIILNFDPNIEPDSPYASDQTSDFNGPTTWDLFVNIDGGTEYLDTNCNGVPSGRFINNGTITGSVFIDIP